MNPWELFGIVIGWILFAVALVVLAIIVAVIIMILVKAVEAVLPKRERQTVAKKVFLAEVKVIAVTMYGDNVFTGPGQKAAFTNGAEWAWSYLHNRKSPENPK